MSVARRQKQIVKVLLLISTVLCLGISAASFALYSHTWPGLNAPAPPKGITAALVLSYHAASLFIFAMILPLCFLKLQLGNRWKLWEPRLARWVTLTSCGFLCISPFLFLLVIPAFYYSLKLADEDFE